MEAGVSKKRKLLEKLLVLPPEMRYEEVEAILTSFGFVCDRSKGSHHQFRHPKGCQLTVPRKSGQRVTRTYLRLVAKALECATGRSVEELVEER